MNRKRFVATFALLVAISFIILGAVFTSNAAQNGTQSPSTPAPGRPISPRFPLPQTLTNQFTGANAGAQAAYSDYVRLTDDADLLSIEVPAEWKDVESGPWVIKDKTVGIFIAAAPDLADFYASRSAAGVFFGASRDLVGSQRVQNMAQTLNPAVGQVLSDESSRRQEQCQNGGRFAYRDNFYAGNYDLHLNCTRGSRGEITLVSMPPSQQYLTLLRIHITSRADLDAATHIFNTYEVTTPSLRDDD